MIKIPKTPHQIADERMKLAYEHAELGQQLVEIKKIKATEWLKLRKDCKSDAQAERKWDGTEIGIKEMEIRASMKSKEIRMSALKTQIDVLNHEAYNQY